MSLPDRSGLTLGFFLLAALLFGERDRRRAVPGALAALAMGTASDLLTLTFAALLLAFLARGPLWRRGAGAGLLLLGLGVLGAPGVDGAVRLDLAALGEAGAEGGRAGWGLALLLVGGWAAWAWREMGWGPAALAILVFRVGAGIAPAGEGAVPLLAAAPLLLGKALREALVAAEGRDAGGGEGDAPAALALFGLGLALLARHLDRPDLAALAFTGALGLIGLAALLPLFVRGGRAATNEAGGRLALLAALAPLPVPGAAGAGFAWAVFAAALGAGRVAPLLLLALAVTGGVLIAWAGIAFAAAAWPGATSAAPEPPLAARHSRLAIAALLIAGLVPALAWHALAPLGAALGGAIVPPDLPPAFSLLPPLLGLLLVFASRKAGVSEDKAVSAALARALVADVPGGIRVWGGSGLNWAATRLAALLAFAARGAE